MLHSLSKDHQRAVTSYLGHGPKDLVLVSVCGSRVRVHSHLLVLHSPLVASLLVEEGGEGRACVTFQYAHKLARADNFTHTHTRAR